MHITVDGAEIADVRAKMRHYPAPSREVAERALFAMREGEISSRSMDNRYGFRAMWLSRKIEGRLLEYQVARDRVAAYLRENVQRQAIDQYLSRLMGRATIDGGIDLVGLDSPPAR